MQNVLSKRRIFQTPSFGSVGVSLAGFILTACFCWLVVSSLFSTVVSLHQREARVKWSPLTDAAIRTASRSAPRQSSVRVCRARWPGQPGTDPPAWTVSTAGLGLTWGRGARRFKVEPNPRERGEKKCWVRLFGKLRIFLCDRSSENCV